MLIVLGAIVQNLVIWVAWCLGFVHPCCTTLQVQYIRNMVSKLYTVQVVDVLLFSTSDSTVAITFSSTHMPTNLTLMYLCMVKLG
jgi:hypothetical protein